MLFYQIGEAFERFAVGRSRRSISALMNIRPDSATLKSAEQLYTVAPEEVAVGETIIVKGPRKLLLNNIASMGFSLYACRLLRLRAGAASVLMFALARTTGAEHSPA